MMTEIVEAQAQARWTVEKILRYHPADIEDVLQNAALKALRGRFRGDSKFKTWFHRIAVNEALMQLRRYRRRMRETPMPEWQGEDGDMDLEPVDAKREGPFSIGPAPGTAKGDAPGD